MEGALFEGLKATRHTKMRLASLLSIDLEMLLACFIIEVLCGLIEYCAFVHTPNTWLIFGTFINVNYFTEAKSLSVFHN